MCNIIGDISGNYVVEHITLSKRNHVWSIIIFYCSRVQKIYNWKRIQDSSQEVGVWYIAESGKKKKSWEKGHWMSVGEGGEG